MLRNSFQPSFCTDKLTVNLHVETVGEFYEWDGLILAAATTIFNGGGQIVRGFGTQWVQKRRFSTYAYSPYRNSGGGGC